MLAKIRFFKEQKQCKSVFYKKQIIRAQAMGNFGSNRVTHGYYMKFFIGCSDTLSRQRGSIIRADASHAANTHSYPPFPQGVALGYPIDGPSGLIMP
jgi:hypothetical protein